MQVKASGVPGNSKVFGESCNDVVTIHFTVTDVNDNIPYFSKKHYQFNLPEGDAHGQLNSGGFEILAKECLLKLALFFVMKNATGSLFFIWTTCISFQVVWLEKWKLSTRTCTPIWLTRLFHKSTIWTLIVNQVAFYL